MAACPALVSNAVSGATNEVLALTNIFLTEPSLDRDTDLLIVQNMRKTRRERAKTSRAGRGRQVYR